MAMLASAAVAHSPTTHAEQLKFKSEVVAAFTQQHQRQNIMKVHTTAAPASTVQAPAAGSLLSPSDNSKPTTWGARGNWQGYGSHGAQQQRGLKREHNHDDSRSASAKAPTNMRDAITRDYGQPSSNAGAADHLHSSGDAYRSKTAASSLTTDVLVSLAPNLSCRCFFLVSFRGAPPPPSTHTPWTERPFFTKSILRFRNLNLQSPLYFPPRSSGSNQNPERVRLPRPFTARPRLSAAPLVGPVPQIRTTATCRTTICLMTNAECTKAQAPAT